MSDLENDIAGALRSSDHVKETLIEEIRKSDAFSSYLSEKIEEDRKAAEKKAKDAKDAAPKITQLKYWKQSKVFGPSLGFLAVFGTLTGLTLADVVQPRHLAHRIMATDDRVVDIISGNSTTIDSSVIKDALDGRIISLFQDRSKNAKQTEFKAAIRSAVAERPFLVFPGWRMLELVPEQPVFSDQCASDLNDLENSSAHLVTEIERTARVIANAKDHETGKKWKAKTTGEQAEKRLIELVDQKRLLLAKCIAELEDPEVMFSFYADLERDSVGVTLRVLKYRDGEGLNAVNQRESRALKAALTSVSLNNPDGKGPTADVTLKFVEDGILKATVKKEVTEAIANKNDPIYHLIVSLDRELLGTGFDGTSYIVGSVVQLNREGVNGL